MGRRTEIGVEVYCTFRRRRVWRGSEDEPSGQGGFVFFLVCGVL